MPYEVARAISGPGGNATGERMMEDHTTISRLGILSFV